MALEALTRYLERVAGRAGWRRGSGCHAGGGGFHLADRPRRLRGADLPRHRYHDEDQTDRGGRQGKQ